MFKDLRETIEAYKARDPAARSSFEAWNAPQARTCHIICACKNTCIVDFISSTSIHLIIYKNPA